MFYSGTKPTVRMLFAPGLSESTNGDGEGVGDDGGGENGEDGGVLLAHTQVYDCYSIDVYCTSSGICFIFIRWLETNFPALRPTLR